MMNIKVARETGSDGNVDTIIGYADGSEILRVNRRISNTWRVAVSVCMPTDVLVAQRYASLYANVFSEVMTQVMLGNGRAVFPEDEE